MLKRFFILIVSVLFTSPLFVAANSTNHIELKGSLSKPNQVKSLTGPVIANFDDPYLELEFTQSLGSLTITVTDDQENIVYKTTIIAIIGGTLSINTGLWPDGDYYLTISDPEGGLLEGWFTI